MSLIKARAFAERDTACFFNGQTRPMHQSVEREVFDWLCDHGALILECKNNLAFLPSHGLALRLRRPVRAPARQLPRGTARNGNL